ncbi:serine/threonine-protein phosphatase 7 long form-like protein [Cucumis melo var. makuwa]|uniref:Serine/threonine-protein phosphatase 7 long form-like protein n=1 Tax=Cucumis melo var. makuwa TaxID=1194695 RepID=A0A5D3DCV8_CUCMM|nr:serine/threonine-protein phosphatase 7 long form-like protein [Cucumis melo var. makuwa]
MLTTLSIDANGHIFPLAFAIVEGKNASSWSWFLYALRQYVTDRDDIYLISDKHRGILAAINNEEIGWSEPRAFHQYCLRHVPSNFNNKYKLKQLKDLVFRASNQHQRRKFIRTMKELKQLNPECLEYFEDIDLQKWTQSHDNGMDPCPVDDSHLYLQTTRSQSIWDTSSTVVLSCRRREAASQRTIPFDQRIAPYLDVVGFLGAPKLVQLVLSVDGEPLAGSLRYNWKVICIDFLEVVPPKMKGQQLSLPWLAEQFQELPPNADIVSVHRYARAYIMQLIGGFLFADKLNTLVHCMFLQFIFDFEQVGTYVWGVATLAWLYRELYCASNAQSLEIAGPLMLLQVWAYNKFPIVGPQRPL